MPLWVFRAAKKKERKRMNLFVPNLIFYRIKEGSRLTGLSESTTHPKRPSGLLFLTIGPKTKKSCLLALKRGLASSHTPSKYSFNGPSGMANKWEKNNEQKKALLSTFQIDPFPESYLDESCRAGPFCS